MTAAEFEAVRPLLNISDERAQAARAALVEGQTLQAAANVYGWSRQAVGDAVGIVWRTRERYYASQRASANAETKLPNGWEKVVLIAPTHLIPKFRGEILAATQQPKKKSNVASKKQKQKSPE